MRLRLKRLSRSVLLSAFFPLSLSLSRAGVLPVSVSLRLPPPLSSLTRPPSPCSLPLLSLRPSLLFLGSIVGSASCGLCRMPKIGGWQYTVSGDQYIVRCNTKQGFVKSGYMSIIMQHLTCLAQLGVSEVISLDVWCRQLGNHKIDISFVIKTCLNMPNRTCN